MSMRKDREITIIRESVTKSSRPVGRLSVSLTEALLGDSLDPLLSLHESSSINEDRAPLPGGNKENGKFIDRHPEFRKFAADQRMSMGDSRSVSFNIDGVPTQKVYLSMNKKGAIRAYSHDDKGNDEAHGWRRSEKPEEPALEITPDTKPAEQPNSRDADVDAQNADDAATRQAAEDERLRQLENLPGESNDDSEDDSDSDAEDGDGGDDTSDGTDNDDTNDDQPPFPGDEDAPEGLEDRVADTMTYGDVPSGIMASPPEEGGEEGTDRPQDEPEGGDVIDGPPDGQGGGGNPPPPPTGDAKAVSDYIDQVAAGAETVDLSEIRRPLHKRSLVELLYSS